jgi:hypothetical protein
VHIQSQLDEWSIAPSGILSNNVSDPVTCRFGNDPNHRLDVYGCVNMKMNVQFVTAIVLPQYGEPHRTLSVYLTHYQSLVDAGVPLCVFVDERIEDIVTNCLSCSDSSNFHELLLEKRPPSYNPKPGKDTASCMSIQLQKLRWVAEATAYSSAPYFCVD